MTAPKQTPGLERFIRAWGTIAYHEMLLVRAGADLTMWIYGVDSANTFGFWTFTVLFFARISAKLNLFLRRSHISIPSSCPMPWRHLASHFRISRLNWVFPVSVTALTFAVACWLERLTLLQIRRRM